MGGNPISAAVERTSDLMIGKGRPTGPVFDLPKNINGRANKNVRCNTPANWSNKGFEISHGLLSKELEYPHKPVDIMCHNHFEDSLDIHLCLV